MAFWNFNDFLDAVVEKIPEQLSDVDIEDIRIEKITKNNGIQCTGLLILESGNSVAPNIYMEYYYNKYQTIGRFDAVLDMIASEYKRAMYHIGVFDIETLKNDYQDKVVLKLVNTELNKDILKNSPHITMNDLSYTVRYVVKDDDLGIASTHITNNDINNWGISSEELFDLAKENTRRMYPPIIKNMREVLPDIDDLPFEIDEEHELYILTNEKGINGATSMIFTDVIDKFSQEKNNASFYIIPSSIHEVMLVKKSNEMDVESLSCLIREVNKFVVNELDLLSDNLYEYDATSKEITQCTGLENDLHLDNELEP